MRRLTDEDIDKIKGSTIQEYRVEAVRIRRGPYIDSDSYGFILGKNRANEYVTWQFHLRNDESVSVYWGHYIADREEAFRDFEARSVDSPQTFLVTVTETFQLTIEIEAESKQRAEQIVSTDWRRGELALGPECFAGVEFEGKPADD